MVEHRRFRGWEALLLLLLPFLLLRPPVVAAHGGGTPQLVNEPVGPYLLSVWTTPDPVRVGELHLTVSVADAVGGGREAGEPVLGADVQIRLEPQAASQDALLVRASNEQATNKLFYEADVALPAEGAWQVTLEVSGPEGSGQAGFALEALPAQETNWLLYGGAGVAVVVALFVVQTLRQQDERVEVRGSEA